MKKIILLLIVAHSIYGCSVYQPKKGLVGYADEKISENKYRVTYYGVTMMYSDEKLSNYWHKRASELCGKGKYTGNPSKETKRNCGTELSMGVLHGACYNDPYYTGIIICKK